MLYSPLGEKVAAALSEQSDRDKQRRIGPSELGDTCQRCLAEKLLLSNEAVEVPESAGLAPLQGQKTLSATIGTAVHEHLHSLLENKEGLLAETKVKVGEVAKYGPITGTCDLYDTATGIVMDFKVMGVKRINSLARSYTRLEGGYLQLPTEVSAGQTATKYYAQICLYGRGLELAGHTPKYMSLFLIPRDNPTAGVSSGAKELRFHYSRAYADRVLDYASALNEWALDNMDQVRYLPSDPGCWDCGTRRY